MDWIDYDLPPELIAQRPAPRRELSRLMTLRRSDGLLAHRHFRDIIEIFAPGDVLVVNDTRVFPARLRGRRRRSGGKVELLLLEPRPGGRWTALIKSGKRLPAGEQLALCDDALTATVIEALGGGQYSLEFDRDPAELERLIDAVGEVPLPPYIESRAEDRAWHEQRYQTVYARHRGAVAAPTAGLHFTDEILASLQAKGVKVHAVTLHVGLGTFQPIRAERVEDHAMHGERYVITDETAAALDGARAAGRRLFACGTTTVRTLESYARSGQRQGVTELFIRPPFEFHFVGGLITNFHLPRTTLLLLVAAFAGDEQLRRAYQTAVAKRYRFYSYGDAMVIY